MGKKSKKLVADFFMLMALTTSVSYIAHPSIYELITAVTLNLVATILKIGTRGMLNIEYLATSIVADAHLIPALFLHESDTAEAVSLVWGAVVANIVSIVIMLIEAIMGSLAEEEEEEY